MLNFEETINVMTYKIILLLVVFSSVIGMNAQQKEVIQILEVQTFKDSITAKPVQLIDVRTPAEYDSGHIEYAQNIDFFSETFSEKFNNLNKQEPVYIYCKSGNRSGQSSLKLKEMGFEKIYDLKGGFLNYK